ncbi:MAG TPA: hypothetical protein P5114_06995, partial [Hyphomicrobiaceae bacterium]|nr:hypothetical protein [Hyphomicrobiaceae bacterium]
MSQSTPPGHRAPKATHKDKTSLDPRCNAVRADLADGALRGKVDAERFVEGQQRQVIQAAVPLRSRPDLKA